MIQNNPNRIKQSGFCCVYCGKQYKTRKYLDNHVLLCEILSNPNLKRQIEREEETPSPKQMYQIIIELAAKCNRLESKIAELEPFVRKQKKINVLEWLNTNPKPEISFDKFHESIQITKEDVDFLFHNSCTDTIQEILRREIYEKYEFPIFPVFACNAKTYIYHDIWQECARDIMIRFLDKVHIKLIQQVSTWKKEYLDANKDDEGTELYNKATVKLMNMDFKKESVFSKIKTVMYTRIKMDI
jgi:hypothetical protein